MVSVDLPVAQEGVTCDNIAGHCSGQQSCGLGRSELVSIPGALERLSIGTEFENAVVRQ